MRSHLLAVLVVLAAAAAPGSSAARTSATLCLEAIRTVEARVRWLPSGLLTAIALTESAHRPAGMDRTVPWPWTINSPKGSFYLDSRRAAVAKVEELRALGVTNIDVGCMQVNLHFHPDAFHSLDDAFHPPSNVGYAARFLTDLQRNTDKLFDAVGRYHSGTPWRSRAYAQKVYARWGKAGEVAPPSKHGLGRPDSPLLTERRPDPREQRTLGTGPGRWQRVYSGTSRSGAERTDVVTRSSGSWLTHGDGRRRDVPRGAGQIGYR
jgi:hypothetical protein